MELNEITVNVKCDVKVDEWTAEMCLKLLEVYLNSDHGKTIFAKRRRDGYVEYRIVDKKANKESPAQDEVQDDRQE